MYSDFILVDGTGRLHRSPRLPLGETSGRNEAWLRDTLLAGPEALPISDIAPSYGPLVPLCRELRTSAGSVDLAFVNPDGLLTFVECKLWRNPEARRKVVAQILDYARVISRWSYSDLQRQVSAATGRAGNVPFELVRERYPDLEEHRFVEAVARSMRAGRFLLLVAGDGIHDDVGAIADLINRNAALGFSFGLVEVALYDFNGTLAIQPRVIARTHLLERTVVLVKDQTESLAVADEEPEADSTETQPTRRALASDLKPWWDPILESIRFDDPEQEPPKYVHANTIRTPLPWANTWISAYRGSPRCGVFLGGREEPLRELIRRLDAEALLADLPTGTRRGEAGGFVISRRESEFATEDDERRWLAETLNHFVNAMRPRIRKLDD
jgi:hypothetical protein